MDRIRLAQTDPLLTFAERCDGPSGFMHDMRYHWNYLVMTVSF
jgi:hypothetical protein